MIDIQSVASQHRWSVIDGMRVATVGDPQSPRQVLAFMGILACVEAFELQRFDLLSKIWDAQVTIVDTPGFGWGGARLTRPERRALRRGDFTLAARRMVTAAQGHNYRLRRGPVILAGYSMGASLAGAAAADPGLLRTTAVVLIEPVALRRWRLTKLLHSVRLEDRYLSEYLDNNRDVTGAVWPAKRRGEPMLPRSRGDLLHLGYALSRGHLMRDLLYADIIEEFPLQIVHGRDSKLSRAGDNHHLAQRCRRAGMPVSDHSVQGRHALWHSLPNVAELARLTRAQWPD